LATTSTALKDDFANLKADEGTAWVFRNIMPIGLFFANAYIITGIWLTPVLIPLWAAFFLLHPIFELSTALKKGAAVCVSFTLYPFLIHLLVGFCRGISGQSSLGGLERIRFFLLLDGRRGRIEPTASDRVKTTTYVKSGGSAALICRSAFHTKSVVFQSVSSTAKYPTRVAQPGF
jgi:hypothetical protein